MHRPPLRGVIRGVGVQLPLSVGVLCSAFVGHCHVRPLAAQRCATGTGPGMTENLQVLQETPIDLDWGGGVCCLLL